LAFAFNAAFADAVGGFIYVDHLTTGYYVWELSLFTLAVYFYRQWRERERSTQEIRKPTQTQKA
jgi:hypothetical protein